jgi:hypothetical protein
VAAVRATAGALLERGYARMHIVTGDAVVAPGEVAVHDVLIGPGCGTVLGAVGTPGADLDLYLATVDGRLIDRDVRVDPSARVSACAERSTVHRVQVKAYGRRVRYAIATLAAPVGVRTVAELRMLEAEQPLAARGYVEVAAGAPTLATDERFETIAEIPAGACIAVIAAGEEGVSDLDLFVRDASRETLLASDTGPAAHAAVSRCAEAAPERVHIELVVYHGDGEVLWRIIRRP